MTRLLDHTFGIFWRNRILPALMILTLMSGIVACGQEPPPANPASAEPAEPLTPAPPVTQETRNRYGFYCTQCHGLQGKGDGINARFLTVPPRDHTKSDYLET